MKNKEWGPWIGYNTPPDYSIHIDSDWRPAGLKDDDIVTFTSGSKLYERVRVGDGINWPAVIAYRVLGGKDELSKPGYHLTRIKKGVYGHPSKILEEAEELIDAHAQGCKIMETVELSDLYGAIETYSKELGLTMHDLSIMSGITKRAFRNGHR